MLYTVLIHLGDVQSCILSFIFATHPFSWWKFPRYHSWKFSCYHDLFSFCRLGIRHRPWHKNKCANEPTLVMVRQIPVCFFLLTVVLSVAGAKWVYPPFPQYHIKGAQKQNLSITCIMRPANREMPAVKRSAPLALGYRCAYCTSEFDSKTGMDWHPTSLGTPCADPENSKSMSFTARANVASSILRQHDTLGATAIPAHCMFILLLSVT